MADVVALKLAVVHIWVGTNDIAGQWRADYAGGGRGQYWVIIPLRHLALVVV